MKNPLRRAYNQLSRLIINEGFADLAKKYKLEQNTSDYNDAKAVYQAINRNDKLKNFYKREMVSKLGLSSVSELGNIDKAYSEAFPTVEDFLTAYDDYVTPKDGVIPYEAKIKQAVEDNQLNKLRTDSQNLIKRYAANIVQQKQKYIVYKVRTFEEAKQMRWLWMGDVPQYANPIPRERFDPNAPDESQPYQGDKSPKEMAEYMMSNNEFIMNPSWCVCAGEQHWNNYKCSETNEDGSASCHLIFSKEYPNCRFCVVRNDYYFEIRDPWQGGGVNTVENIQYGYEVMQAVFGDDVKKIKCLHGVAEKIQATKLATKFINALIEDGIEGARQMLKDGADVNAKNEKGHAPLHAAAAYGQTDTCKLLLKYRADANVKDMYGLTPLHRAAWDGHTETCRVLLDHGADANAKAAFDRTPLNYAAKEGHTETCALLLENGADVNAKDKYGVTLLHTAAENGETEICKLLLDNGAKVDIEDENGNTPWGMAAYNGHTEICKLLLEHGADANAKDKYGKTLLYMEAERGRTEICKVLLEHGADANAKEENGWTPLHEAAYNGHTETCKILLLHSADINAKNNNGCSPLHEAARNGHTETCKLLLDLGADVNAKDKYGDSPLQVAERFNHTDICKLLRKYATRG